VECVERGLYLIQDGEQRLAVCIISGWSGSIKVEAVSTQSSVAEQFLSELDSLIKHQNVYKGEILSIGSRIDELHIDFQKLEVVPKESVIFPKGLLEAVEQQTIKFSQHSQVILAAGFSLKRGLLLHGAPGTGKTTLIKYLLGNMKERTALLVNGNGTQHIKEICKLARSVEPSTVVIEDVDLIAKERSYSSDEHLLFELMNEMDGLTSDADILFILTTNRPEVLEPALSSRPGRIDQAIKVPLPDEDCRHRLFELYAKGCDLQVEDMSQFVKKTKDASAAFIHELVRKALLFAAEEGGNPCIRDRHLDKALAELFSSDSKLNRSILGFQALADEAA
jgi:SpoVK/Ycf46/Vps4 family AAA+-type ATPase